MGGMLLVVVGDGVCVPDSALGLVKTEFRGLTVERYDSVADLAALERRPVRLLLVEQEAAELEADLGLPALDAVAAHTLALSYRDEALAARFLERALMREDSARIGFLPVNLQLDCWLSTLRLLLLGHPSVPQSLFRRLHRPRPAADGGDTAEAALPLTRRERQVLELASLGKQNKLIAADLSLSEHTVKLHMHNIIRKMGATNRTEAVSRFLAARHARASA